LRSRPVEEWQSFCNGDGFATAHGTLAVLRLSAKDAQCGFGQKAVNDERDGCRRTLGKGAEWLVDFEREWLVIRDSFRSYFGVCRWAGRQAPTF